MILDEKTIAYIAIVIGSAILFAIYYYVGHKDDVKGKKTYGADHDTGRAATAAKRFARANGFRCIAPATLEIGSSIAHLDAIVVGYFGVLGVKAYGYNAHIYGTNSDDPWLQVGYQEQRNFFQSPDKDASADVRVIREALFAAKLKQVPVEVVCVFTDQKADLAIPKDSRAVNLRNYGELLEKPKYLEDKGLDLDKVENALRAALAN